MKTCKPAWWQLYLLLPIMFVLIAIESLEPVPGISNEIADAGIVALFFVAVLGWVHLNGGLLERYYMEHDGDYDLKIAVYEPKPQDDANDGHDSAWYEMPDSDILLHGRQNIALKEREKWSRN